MRILRDNSTALIIDIQERLFPHITDHDLIARNTRILVRGLRVLNIPLRVTQQYTKGLGPTIEPMVSAMEDFSFIEKTAFSCCDEPEVIMALEAGARNVVILAGIETHVCVLQTAIDLLERGFKPVVIEDCTGSRKSTDKATAMARLRREGTLVSSCESILFELARYSGTPEFKAISALVK